MKITRQELLPTNEESAVGLQDKITPPRLDDVERVYNSQTEEWEAVSHLNIIERDGVMLIEVKPSAFANYSLRAVITGGREAMLYPNRTPDGAVVEIAPLVSPKA